MSGTVYGGGTLRSFCAYARTLRSARSWDRFNGTCEQGMKATDDDQGGEAPNFLQATGSISPLAECLLKFSSLGRPRVLVEEHLRREVRRLILVFDKLLAHHGSHKEEVFVQLAVRRRRFLRTLVNKRRPQLKLTTYHHFLRISNG